MTPGVWESIVAGAKSGRINIDQPFEVVRDQAIRWLFGLTALVEKEIQPNEPESPIPAGGSDRPDNSPDAVDNLGSSLDTTAAGPSEPGV